MYWISGRDRHPLETPDEQNRPLQNNYRKFYLAYRAYFEAYWCRNWIVINFGKLLKKICFLNRPSFFY